MKMTGPRRRGSGDARLGTRCPSCWLVSDCAALGLGLRLLSWFIPIGSKLNVSVQAEMCCEASHGVSEQQANTWANRPTGKMAAINYTERQVEA